MRALSEKDLCDILGVDRLTYRCAWCREVYDRSSFHCCDKEKIGRTALDGMRRDPSIDWTTWTCPCGDSMDNKRTGSPEYAWVLEHAAHVKQTNTGDQQ